MSERNTEGDYWDKTSPKRGEWWHLREPSRAYCLPVLPDADFVPLPGDHMKSDCPALKQERCPACEHSDEFIRDPLSNDFVCAHDFCRCENGTFHKVPAPKQETVCGNCLSGECHVHGKPQEPTLDSPDFKLPEAEEFAARGYERINRHKPPEPKAEVCMNFEHGRQCKIVNGVHGFPTIEGITAPGREPKAEEWRVWCQNCGANRALSPKGERDSCPSCGSLRWETYHHHVSCQRKRDKWEKEKTYKWQRERERLRELLKHSILTSPPNFDPQACHLCCEIEEALK